MNDQSLQALNEVNYYCILHADYMKFKMDWGVACVFKNRQATPQ